MTSMDSSLDVPRRRRSKPGLEHAQCAASGMMHPPAPEGTHFRKRSRRTTSAQAEVHPDQQVEVDPDQAAALANREARWLKDMAQLFRYSVEFVEPCTPSYDHFPVARHPQDVERERVRKHNEVLEKRAKSLKDLSWHKALEVCLDQQNRSFLDTEASLDKRRKHLAREIEKLDAREKLVDKLQSQLDDLEQQYEAEANTWQDSVNGLRILTDNCVQATSDVDGFCAEHGKRVAHVLSEDFAQTTSESRWGADHLFDEAHALERRCGELTTCEIALECMSGGWDKALLKCRREAYGRFPTVAAVCTAATAQIVADLLRNDEYISQVRRVADMATLGAATRHTGPSPSKQAPAKSMLSSCGHVSSWDEDLSAVSTADVDDGDFSQRCASSSSDGHEFHGRIHTTHWDVEARSWSELSHSVLESRCSTPVEMPSCAWLPVGARSFQRVVTPTKICSVIPRSTAPLAAIRA